MKIVLFNGPPRSGKDTCSNMLAEHIFFRRITHENVYSQTQIVKFAEPLRKVLKAVFAIDDDFIDFLEQNELKDEPRDEFFGHSFRQMMIHVSENYLKPLLGSDCMGKLAIRNIQKLVKDYMEANPRFIGEFWFVFSDLGFKDELQELCNEFGEENITVIQLSKTGTDFKKDSRGYVDHSRLFYIENNGSINELNEKMKELSDVLVNVYE